MAEINLTVEKRVATSKGAVKQLRREGKIPGVFYIGGKEALPFSVSEIDIKPFVFTSENHIINLTLGKEKPVRCILKETQFDPVTDKVVHVDFQGLTKGHALQLQIPVVLTGESIGILNEGGVLQHAVHKLDVECLPKDIPEHFRIDISDMNIGDAVHVRDLDYENIKILNAEDVLVVAINTPKKEVIAEEPVEEVGEEEPAEPEVISKGKSEETEQKS
jgi:large subunit ribosomal protein L25